MDPFSPGGAAGSRGGLPGSGGLQGRSQAFRQVLQAVQKGGADWQALTVDEVMLRDPLAASPNMEMDELRRLMVEHHQRYLPVMEDHTLLGVVSFHDVAKAVLEEQSFENRMLKNYIRNWPASEDEEQ